MLCLGCGHAHKALNRLASQPHGHGRALCFDALAVNEFFLGGFKSEVQHPGFEAAPIDRTV
jgi:hypothetical protein